MDLPWRSFPPTVHKNVMSAAQDADAAQSSDTLCDQIVVSLVVYSVDVMLRVQQQVFRHKRFVEKAQTPK